MPFFFLFVLVTSWLNPPDSVRFGVLWDVPTDAIEAKKDISYFQKNGYQELMINGIVPVDVMDLINRYDFVVHINLGHSFLTNTILHNQKDAIEAELYDFYYYYRTYDCIQSYGIFTYGSVFDESFANGIQVLKNRIASTVKQPLYYIHQPDSTDLLHTFNFDRYLNYSPKITYSSSELTEFEGLIYSGNAELFTSRVFQDMVYQSNGKTIFIPSSIVFDEQKQEMLNTWILAFLKDTKSLLELDPLKTEQNHPDYLVFLFWCCVVIFGSHYSFEPNYRKSVSRYFLAHPFFSADIMDNRVRISFSTILAGFVQMILAGMMTLLFFDHILSPLGQQAFVHEFSYFDYFSGSKFGIFIAGMVQYALFMSVQIFWLYFTIKDFKSIFQPATLLFWPQLINLFISIIVVNAFFNQVSGFWILIFSMMYLFMVLFSFFFALNDVMKSGRKTTTKDLLKTAVPYFIILIYSFTFYFSNIGFYDMLELAYHLR
ncbi:hypothetical protein EP331_05745 [bacterium]|nr:MAG: hypothetical protein EP331_05745 [bacterium]